MSNKELVLLTYPGAYCDATGGFEGTIRKSNRWTIRSEFGIALGTSSLDSEETAWRYAADKIRGRGL